MNFEKNNKKKKFKKSKNNVNMILNLNKRLKIMKENKNFEKIIMEL